MQQTEQRKTERWMFSVPALLVLTMVIFAVIQLRPGGTAGVMLYYLGPFITAILALAYMITGIVRAIRHRPFFNSWRAGAFILLIPFLFTDSLYSKYPSSHDDKPSAVPFRLPLDTPVSVAWGGGNEQVNYHVSAPDQCWAYDLLVMRNGKTHGGDSTQLKNYFCYGLPVKAPCNGKVVSAFGSDPDMRPGELGGGTLPHGNHIVVEVSPNEFLFICHLQPGSLKVQKGDSIRAGQEIASVGNSGNTSEPHIHMHLQDNPRPQFGEGIPMLFHHYTENGKLVEKGIPTGGFDDNGTFRGQTVQHASVSTQ